VHCSLATCVPLSLRNLQLLLIVTIFSGSEGTWLCLSACEICFFGEYVRMKFSFYWTSLPSQLVIWLACAGPLSIAHARHLPSSRFTIGRAAASNDWRRQRTVRLSSPPLERTWRQGCLGARSGCLEHLRLSRGRLKSSRAARLSREGSGYLGRFRLSRAVSSYLEPPGYLERAQVVSSISGHLEAASSYLERPGYLERAQDISSARDISRGASR
jgi:hypothetical protein